MIRHLSYSSTYSHYDYNGAILESPQWRGPYSLHSKFAAVYPPRSCGSASTFFSFCAGPLAIAGGK